VLQAAQVPEVLQQVQQAATQPVQRGQEAQHYIWCKARLRQGDALGLAEVWRFLHDLEQVETITNPQLRHLRDHVYKQLSAEMAAALHRTRAVAQRLLSTALSSPQPVVLP
jgi:RNA polymerase-interacting CarD/CdnL/TRCF family regulator